MAKSINQVIVMGNLTRDPDLRSTTSGNKVVGMSLALNTSYQDPKTKEFKEKTEYIDIVAWGSLAERVAKYLSKGRRCLVQGKLQQRSWEQDGQKRSKVEILASDVTFLDSSEEGQQKSTQNNSSNGSIDLSDIPF